MYLARRTTLDTQFAVLGGVVGRCSGRASVVGQSRIDGSGMDLSGWNFVFNRWIVHAVQRPDPLPKVFVFHEVFHVFVTVAVAIHYGVIAQYLIPI